MRRQPASVEMATGSIDRGLVKLFVACAGVDREGSAGGAFLGVDDGVVAVSYTHLTLPTKRIV